MTIHRVMGREGDVVHAFNPQDKAEVAAAMERFKRLTGGQGMWASTTAESGERRLVKSFEANTDVIFAPQLQGG